MARNQELYPTDFPEVTPSPQAVLRSHLPEVGDLGLQEGDVPEGLGSFTQEDVGEPVSDEQAQRWMEEREIYDAKYILQGLRDQMLNSRRNLIDELYGGDDPSLRNTKPIIDEFTKMEVATLKEALGDPEEMTPEQKLQAATMKINLGRAARARVEDEKDKDIEILNNSVAEYNKEIEGQMKFIQGRAMTLRELHATQDEAVAKAEAELVEEKEPKSVDQQRLFNMNKHFHKLIEEGKEIPESQLRIYNKLANKLGEKSIVKKKKGKKGWSVPWLGWTFGQEKPEYGTQEGNIRRYNPASGRLE